jgi:hypothetical protein
MYLRKKFTDKNELLFFLYKDYILKVGANYLRHDSIYVINREIELIARDTETSFKGINNFN